MALEKRNIEWLCRSVPNDSSKEDIVKILNEYPYSKLTDICSDLIKLYKDKEMPKQQTVKKIRITAEQLTEFFQIYAMDDTIPIPIQACRRGRPTKNAQGVNVAGDTTAFEEGE